MNRQVDSSITPQSNKRLGKIALTSRTFLVRQVITDNLSIWFRWGSPQYVQRSVGDVPETDGSRLLWHWKKNKSISCSYKYLAVVLSFSVRNCLKMPKIAKRN